jgi:cytochrome P450
MLLTLQQCLANGIDKTMASTWSCILALALHPDIQRKGHAIVDAIFEGRLPDFSDIDTIPYVDAIVNESLRWNPVTPLGVPHCAREDDHYDGHLIKKGTMVFGNIWALLRDENAYGSDTDKFIPERWLTKDGTFNTDMDTETAFGFGRRICPGKGNFADEPNYVFES